ncbi:ROK family protein [Streptomyces sp. NPDC056713]|uniref:ROK family protein n=1 Tax=Streptomyces sp. NPDC056713 TaxID=3345921 RepID=UPI00367472BB
MTVTRGPRSSAALLEAAVLSCFDTAPTLNRAEVARHTGLSRTVVTSVLNTLVDRGTLSVVAGSPVRTPGRPAIAYQLRAFADPVGLIRFGETTSVLTVVSPAGPYSAVPISKSATQPDRWAAEVLELLEKAGSKYCSPVRQVVVAAPFPVSQDGHPAIPASAVRDERLAGHFRAVEEAHARLSATLRQPVVLVNDAQLAGLGEAVFGAATGDHSSVHLSVRHGFGCGIVIGGHLFTGPGGTAGEIAHVQISADGRECLCGGRGCLATLLTSKHTDHALATLYGRPLTPVETNELVAARDPMAMEFYQDIGHKAARALAGLVTVLTPDVIVIDAELGPAHIPFTTSLADGLAEHCPPTQLQDLRLVRGRLLDAQAYGAVALRLDAPGRRGTVTQNRL